MSDEIFELRQEIIALKEIVGKLEGKNAELSEKNGKLKKENESLKAENSQLKNSSESNVAIQTSKPVEGSSESPIIEKLKARFFKNWLLFDTLPWIDRKELANSSLSTASETFRQLCWPKLHGNVKPHKISYMRISGARYELGKFRALVHIRTGNGWSWGREEVIPIASIPPLDYILGIEMIEINFLNDEVMNFLKNIEDLIQNCKLEMSILNKKHIASSVRILMDFLANKIFLLHFGWRTNQLRLNDFNKFFPGFIDNIQFIRFSAIPNIDEIDVILNWLTKVKNGKQKLFQFIHGRDEKFMPIFNSRINEEFANSNSPSTFLINFWTYQNFDEFTLENVRTNEILALYFKGMVQGYGWDDDYYNYYIVRYSKGEEHWKEDGENKIREHQIAENFTSISINIA